MQKTCIDYLKMHSECTILMQFLKTFPGETPGPHLRKGVTPSPTLPLSALRASVKPSASLVTCAPRQWRFWIRPWSRGLTSKFLTIHANSALGDDFSRMHVGIFSKTVWFPCHESILRLLFAQFMFDALQNSLHWTTRIFFFSKALISIWHHTNR